MKTVFQTVDVCIVAGDSKISVWCVGNNEIKFVNYYSQTVNSSFAYSAQRTAEYYNISRI